MVLSRKDMPKVTFCWSVKTEAERVAHAAKQAASGFYGRNGYKVVEGLPARADASWVCLPRLDYGKLEMFWEKVARMEVNFPVNMKQQWRQELINQLSTKIRIDEKLLKKYEKEWQTIEHELWSLVAELELFNLGEVKEIEIRLTQFGSISSFGFLDENSEKLICFVRVDGGLAQVVEAILTGFLWRDTQGMEGSWEGLEMMVDYLLTKTALADLVMDYKPTLVAVGGNINHKEREMSRQYLVGLGCLTAEERMDVKYGKVMWQGKSLASELTRSQIKLLKLLLDKKGVLVDYDDVAELMFPDPDDYSLWAMQKHIQRLRKKLDHIGYGGWRLKSLKGRGLLLDA